MRRPFRNVTVGAMVGTLLIGAAAATAAPKSHMKSNQPAKAPVANQEKQHAVAYLGLGVERLYGPLSGRLRELLGNGQGILVARVAPGSPAEKAGIKPNDILMTYGDQKLFSPDQLAKLVRSDKVGREVTLSVVREAKVTRITAKLGEHRVGIASSAPPAPEEGWWWWGRFPRWEFFRGRTPRWATRGPMPGQQASNWERFDSMTIKNHGNDRFKAEIQYLDKEGKMHHQEFQGTPEQIHKAIVARKDLPRSERQDLLRALNLPNEEGLVSTWVIPGGSVAQELTRPIWVY